MNRLINQYYPWSEPPDHRSHHVSVICQAGRPTSTSQTFEPRQVARRWYRTLSNAWHGCKKPRAWLWLVGMWLANWLIRCFITLLGLCLVLSWFIAFIALFTWFTWFIFITLLGLSCFLHWTAVFLTRISAGRELRITSHWAVALLVTRGSVKKRWWAYRIELCMAWWTGAFTNLFTCHPVFVTGFFH